MAGAAARGHVPVAQLDKASDYESEDWGFESLQGLTFLFFIYSDFFFFSSVGAWDRATLVLPGCPRGLRGQT